LIFGPPPLAEILAINGVRRRALSHWQGFRFEKGKLILMSSQEVLVVEEIDKYQRQLRLS